MFKNCIVFTILSLIFISYIHAAPSDQTNLNDIAKEVYIYAYPLVLMDITKNVMTNVSAPVSFGPGMKTPVNQFANMMAFPSPTFEAVVRPNADTLYASAWLDLTKEPMVLSVPNSEGRYYLLPMLDAWTNVFASPGTRTTGNKSGNFVIVGPAWKGTIPAGLKTISAPTNLVWLVGRIQTNGPTDYDNVHKFQKQLKLVPLSAWHKGKYTPPTYPVNPKIDMQTSPPKQVASMDGLSFFKHFTNLLKTNPPHPSDTKIITQMKRLGINPGKDLDETTLTKEQKEAMNQAQNTTLPIIRQSIISSSKPVNGWIIRRKDIGSYDNHYMTRAGIALVGLGANLPQDAIYPITFVDNQGQPLNGENRYVIHFAKNQIPPVNGFWSLTLYNPSGYFVENQIHRYAIGDRDKLHFNEDGSLDIFIQHEPPADQSNWLPAPKSDFNLTLRLYWPKVSVINGEWSPPGVIKQK